jgi:hypothetical protein
MSASLPTPTLLAHIRYISLSLTLTPMSFGIIVLFFIIMIGLASTILWIWAIIDLVRNENLDSNAKIIWVIVIVIFPFVGSIVYLVAGRNQGRRVV